MGDAVSDFLGFVEISLYNNFGLLDRSAPTIF